MGFIRPMNIDGLDLNLIRVLHALFETRGVSAAAARLGLSQPAVSNALRRLRAAFGDPLFVRGRGGMAPTPRAEALAPQIAQAMRQIEAALAGGDGVDPAAIREPVLIGCGDEEMLICGPAIRAALDAAGCAATLQFLPLDPDYRAEVLWRHRLALTFSAMVYAPEGLMQRKLYEETLVCLVRADHPAVQGLDLEAYLAAGHMLVAPLGGPPQGIVDAWLRERGRARDIRLVSPSFGAAAWLVRDTGLIASVPRRHALRQPFGDALRLLPLPMALPPFAIHMFWSERYDRDPLNRWLRDLAARAVGEARRGAGEAAPP
ncbi:MAG: LysR family transcriptional regulator [Pseudomonadota bacterium]